MSTDKSYAYQYFRPELHVKSIILTAGALLPWYLFTIPHRKDGNPFLVSISLGFAIRAFFDLRATVLESNEDILTVGPQGILDRRFGPDFIPWTAIERIETAELPTPVDLPQVGGGRLIGRGIIRLLVQSGFYGNIKLPSDFTWTEYRDRRSIKMWLRADARVDQMTTPARLRIRDKADGKQLVYIAIGYFSVTRAELLELMVAFHERYGTSLSAAQP